MKNNKDIKDIKLFSFLKCRHKNILKINTDGDNHPKPFLLWLRSCRGHLSAIVSTLLHICPECSDPQPNLLVLHHLISSENSIYENDK